MFKGCIFLENCTIDTVTISTTFSCECCDTALSVHTSSSADSHRLNFYYCPFRGRASGIIIIIIVCLCIFYVVKIDFHGGKNQFPRW